MKTVTCEVGHGRLPWMGHVECIDCETSHKHQPHRCTALVVSGDATRECGCSKFRAACAKCYASAQASTAASSFDYRGAEHTNVGGHGSAIE